MNVTVRLIRKYMIKGDLGNYELFQLFSVFAFRYFILNNFPLFSDEDGLMSCQKWKSLAPVYLVIYLNIPKQANKMNNMMNKRKMDQQNLKRRGKYYKQGNIHYA